MDLCVAAYIPLGIAYGGIMVTQLDRWDHIHVSAVHSSDEGPVWLETLLL